MVFLPLMLIWLRDPMYFNVPSRWAMVAFAISTGLVAPEMASDRAASGVVAAADSARNPASSNGSSTPSPADSGSTSLLREGTRVDNQIGQFSQADGAWYFTPAAKTAPKANAQADPAAVATNPTSVTPPRPATTSRFRVLENLALQRVVQMIQQDPSDNRWMINGVITEFFGENRLMMALAVRAPIDDNSAR